MTISKGVEWGESIDRPTALRTAQTDAEFVNLVSAADSPPVTITGGDLYRSLGAPRPRREARRLPLDMIDVVLDGVARRAVANILIGRPRRRGWFALGEVILVSNVGFVAEWNAAPRAHPNDGRIDVVEVAAAFGVRQRLQAYRRLPTGTHVPHPLIEYRQVTSAEWSFRRPMRVQIDGEPAPAARHVAVTVVADATSVVI